MMRIHRLPVVLVLALAFAPVAVADVPAGTFSIVARDPQTGELGVAVQSRAFNVGMAVPWAEAGVGAIATQAMTNQSFGPRGLALLRQGMSAPDVLAKLLADDDDPEARQVAVIDARGSTAQHTGKKNSAWAGGVAGKDYACQGNILAGEAVVRAMAKAFEETTGEFSERLLAALVAGQKAGGDRRGKQSAALLVVRPSERWPEYETRYVDLRVDDDPEPIEEIVRLYRILEGTDLVRAHLRYAEEYRAAGRKDAAALELSRVMGILDGALAREGTKATTLNGLAWSLALCDLGLEKALAAAERAVALEPGSFEIRDTLAECLFRIGRFEDAVREGEKALALSPEDAYLRAQLERFRNRWTDVGPGETREDRQVVRMERAGGNSLELGFGTCQWLYPLNAPVEELSGMPELSSAKPVWFAARLGDSEDHTFSMVIDESGGTGKGYDTLYADLDNDNRIDVAKERLAFRMSTTSTAEPLRIELQVTTAGRMAPYSVSFTAFPYSGEEHPEEKIHANLRNASYWVGNLQLAGRPARIAVADLDGNGLFNDVEQRIFRGDRFFLDLDGDGDFRGEGLFHGGRPYELPFHGGYPYGGVTKIRGQWCSVAVRPDGGEVTITPVTPALGTLRGREAVVFADLRSLTQPSPVEFANGEADVVAGSYEVRGVVLCTEDREGRSWQAHGTFEEGRPPKVTIPAGGTVELPGGLPLEVRTVVSRDGKSAALSIHLAVTGAAGETYRWNQDNPGPRKPGFEVRDEKGSVIHSATFEYG